MCEESSCPGGPWSERGHSCGEEPQAVLGCSEWPLGEASPQGSDAALGLGTKRAQGLWRGFKTWLDKERMI